MQVTLFDNQQRLLLLLIAVVLGGGALLLRWRSKRSASETSSLIDNLVVAAAVLATVAASVLVVERLISVAIDWAAPSSADFNEYRWVILAPWGRLGLALGVGVVIAIVALSFKASQKLASPWRRAALVGLRAAAAATALVLFLEPAVELRQVAREPNRIAILIDDSRSMALREDAKGPSRAERARQLIDSSASTFAAWRKKHHVDFFTFSEALVPSSQKAASTTEPTGPSTLIRQALEQIRARYDERDLAGVVLVSDGIATGGFADGSGAGDNRDFLRSLDTRVHTAWAGRDGLKDVAIARILADEFAFVRTVVKIEVVVRSTGYRSKRIPVTLSKDGRALRQKWVEIGPGNNDTKVVFELSPPRLGKFVYEISTPVDPSEAVAVNNKRSFVLRVIRDKIRVLQVAGQPSWDVRALRRMLKQNPNVDLISFFILRTQDDVTSVPNSEMSLIPFPTRELFQQELPSFDLIVLQNFEYMPYGIGQYLENIRHYVESGGGLVMLGGDLAFGSGRYGGTPLADALPVELPAMTFSRRDVVDTEMFRPQLTRRGRGHPVTALRYERKDNLKTWASLPELEGVNIIGDARKGATVLAVHPKLKTASGKKLPVIVAGEYGDGRTLAVTTDSLWRWDFVAAGRAGGDGRHYHKFWESSIRWLIHDPDLRYLHVDSDAVEYAPNAPVRLDVRLLDRDYSPLAKGKVKLKISRGTDPKQTKPIATVTLRVNEAGEASHELAGLEPGVYRVRATAKVGGKMMTANDIFLVREGSAELDQPAATTDLLERLAAGTDGQFLGKASRLRADLAFDEPRIVRVDQRSDVELWSRPGLLVLALIFLGLEWLLRQRSGYL